MDAHQWRPGPYQPQPNCPVCFAPHYPYCPPPPPLPPPKRMRVEDSYPLNQGDHRVLNLIRHHGRQADPQNHHHPVYPNGYSNPPYQSIAHDGYRASSTAVHPHGYYAYGYNWAQVAPQPQPPPPPPLPPPAQPPPPPPPPHTQPPPLGPPPHNQLGPMPQKTPSLFPIASTSSLAPSRVYAFTERSPSFSLKQVGSAPYPPSISQPIMNKGLHLTKPITTQPTLINACELLKHPKRASRPDHFVVILRGLPGSGKSYLAKALRDLEVENGGSAPRIHSIDDYFMIEVEKDVKDGECSTSRSKKMTKKVIEYCYEEEMEEAYRSSMLKAFKKTLDEGNFTFIIVDDRNLRVADFSQFWAVAKRSGYEVYLLEAPYNDPTGCAARNLHGFTLAEVHKMAAQWEEAPPLYLQLDARPMLSGDYLKEETIQEVEMDMEDDDMASQSLNIPEKRISTITHDAVSPNNDNGFSENAESPGVQKGRERWDSEEELIGVKDLRKSKWSNNIDDETEKPESSKGNGVLSGRMHSFGRSKIRKCVHWGDRAEIGGFSIGSAARKRTNLSLVIGPGSGYNLKSNPLIDEDKGSLVNKGKVDPETKKLLGEQLRAERESFKAIFDRRRLRIEDE